MSPNELINYKNIEKQLKKNGFFLDFDSDENLFVVGENKYQKKWDFKDEINKSLRPIVLTTHYRGGEELAEILNLRIDKKINT